MRSHDRDIAHLHGRLGGRDSALRPGSAQRQIAQADAKAQDNNGHEGASENRSPKLSVHNYSLLIVSDCGKPSLLKESVITGNVVAPLLDRAALLIPQWRQVK